MKVKELFQIRAPSLGALIFLLASSEANAWGWGGPRKFPSPVQSLSSFCTKENSGNIRKCLKEFLQYRCFMYTFGDLDLDADCSRAVDLLTKKLDLIQGPNPNKKDIAEDGVKAHQIIHTQATIKKFEDINLGPRLDYYRDVLEWSKNNSRKFNFWNLVLSEEKFSKESALFFMSSVFQDTSKGSSNESVLYDGSGKKIEKKPRQIHIYYIKSLAGTAKQKEIRNKNTEAFSGFIKNHSLYKQLSNEAPQFELYPSIKTEINRELVQDLYHFYVPAYFALKVSQKDPLGAWATFMFHTETEFRKINNKLEQGRWPFRAPGPIKTKPQQAKIEIDIRKIYTGYVGVLFGVGKMSKVMMYGKFRKKMLADPYGFMKELYFNTFKTITYKPRTKS